MLAIVASCALALAVVAMAACVVNRRVRAAEACLAALEGEVARLRALLATTSQQVERLNAAIASSPAIAPDLRAPESLAAMEALGDPAALESGAALSAAAVNLSNMRPSAADNLFRENQREQDIVRLYQRGHSPPEIARRLALSLGEVELRLSLRPH
jgi:DNA-binding NarL/FixJ family response regulator